MIVMSQVFIKKFLSNNETITIKVVSKEDFYLVKGHGLNALPCLKQPRGMG
jgi:hypothetical protein